jgi:spore coat protein CotH
MRGLFGGSRQPQPLPNNNLRPPRGTAAFVHVNPKTGQASLFDHININERRSGRGYKVHFHKDNTLNGMTAISLVFEGVERHLMAEALAYDLYRRAGNAASLTDFFRLSIDGRQLGYHLMIENPNRSFLRRNKVDDGGNLYKIRWFGRGVVGQHEKKTNLQTGHDDLVAVTQMLMQARGEDEQWKVIEENFNVQQVANYFAVNMVLSHWDGYFNNYYTYHDLKNNKWEIYPWDQDKTWGYHDGIDHDDVFVTMPLTFGMLGDPRPPDDGRRANPFGAGPAWWRPGGYFSTPLLANPKFRKIFLARVKEILEKHYTEEVYFPVIDEMAERLKDDAALRVRTRGGDANYASQVMEHNVRLLKRHLQKRRAFLLEQDELKKLQ